MEFAAISVWSSCFFAARGAGGTSEEFMENIVTDPQERKQEPIIDLNDTNRESESRGERSEKPSPDRSSEGVLRIFAIDCCPHVVKALSEAPNAQLISVSSQDNERLAPAGEKVSLIVVG